MNYLPPPWYSIEEPYHLENIDDNYNEFYLGLQNFDTKTYYRMAPRNVKNVLKLLKEGMQKSTISISENTLTHIRVIIFSIHTYINVWVFHQFYIIVVIYKLFAMIVEIHFILHVTNGIHITILIYLHEFI